MDPPLGIDILVGFEGDDEVMHGAWDDRLDDSRVVREQDVPAAGPVDILVFGDGREDPITHGPLNDHLE